MLYFILTAKIIEKSCNRTSFILFSIFPPTDALPTSPPRHILPLTLVRIRCLRPTHVPATHAVPCDPQIIVLGVVREHQHAHFCIRHGAPTLRSVLQSDHTLMVIACRIYHMTKSKGSMPTLTCFPCLYISSFRLLTADGCN